MTDERETTARWSQIEAFLRHRGAEGMPHPGGTLLEHLGRVRRLLDGWGADLDVQAAGLCHAVYGTDGFDQSLLPISERAVLAGLIGERAEALVHRYASCDRGAVYPRIDGTPAVLFRDRFTGEEHTPAEADLRAFLDITAANELDVLAHNEDLAARYGASLRKLFARAGGTLSPAARDACERQLGRYAVASASPDGAA